jgi:glutathione S-transferase
MLRQQLEKRFDHVERHLATHEYVFDDRFSVADAYLFVTTGWCGFVGIELEKWPKLAAFRRRIAQRPAVQAALRAEGLAG